MDHLWAECGHDKEREEGFRSYRGCRNCPSGTIVESYWSWWYHIGCQHNSHLTSMHVCVCVCTWVHWYEWLVDLLKCTLSHGDRKKEKGKWNFNFIKYLLWPWHHVQLFLCKSHFIPTNRKIMYIFWWKKLEYIEVESLRSQSVMASLVHFQSQHMVSCLSCSV